MLSQSSVSRRAVLLLNIVHDVMQRSVTIVFFLIGTVMKEQLLPINFLSLTGRPSSVGESDNVDHLFLSPTTINPLAVHHFTSSLIDFF